MGLKLREPSMYELRRHNTATPDEQVTNSLFPLSTWEWFDGTEDTGGV